MSKKYRSYFHINERYFPAVNESVIKNNPDVWKSYFPHDSFIKLLNQTKSVLTNTQRMSIWVEGSYGTGKSHAVLTLKKLLDCNNDELKEYFDNYKTVFKSDDLYNEFYNIKNQSKKILTVHRYGSSDVHNDRTLMDYVQSSIIKALEDAGYSYRGQIGIKQAMINWLSDSANKAYFNSIIQSDEYRVKFGNATADIVLENLKTYTAEKAVQELVEKISAVGEDKGIRPFVLKKEDLKTWILDVVNKNNLKAIFFIWDEFSDYFDLNKGNLSGFQYLAEISETDPFYFAIVTHKSSIFFENSKDDVQTKINGRFIAPHCSIELPDNMAFILTGHAMQKVKDPTVAQEWNEIVDDLFELTNDSREEVIKAAKIGEKELKGVLPIHPYAALVLKHIAAAFDSNQRSMFDFIKNDRGDGIKGFQWYIDNYGPDDDDQALLTVDMLWDFFYEKEKEQLAPQIRTILDVYGRTESHNLNNKEKCVLKTILLLQAINEKVGDSVSLFIPNEKNLGLAFEGTDITAGNANAIAKNLVKEQIIFERPMGNGQIKYSALVSNGNLEEIEKEKERLKREIRTDKLLEEGDFVNDFKLPKNLEIRYVLKLLTFENIKIQLNQIKQDSENNPTRLYAVYTFGRNEEESERVRNEIQKELTNGLEKVVFVDYSAEYLNNDLYNQYIENMANCNYYKGKDATQSKTFDRNAKESLRRWKNKVRSSGAKVFSSKDKIGTVYNSENEIFNVLREYDADHFSSALETHVNVIDNMYQATALKLGAECGITKELRGTFKSTNDNTKLEKQFAGVWNVDQYWIDKPNELISKVKLAVENVIKQKFSMDNRVSIGDIYDVLIDAPFGFVSCNLTAFVLGFVLKEYANNKYNWSDELTTTPMTVDKMREMIDEILKQQTTPNSRYRAKYIVAMSPEQRQFNKSTAYIFGIDESLCTSVENTKSRMRSEMNTYGFPIWTLNYCDFNTINSKDIVTKAIDLYVELANNTGSGRTETDIALELGSLFDKNKALDKDLKSIVSRDNCTLGMKKYLESYRDGKLYECAKAIGDTGSFINEVKNKFSMDSNWVWNKNTVNEKIDDTITEYEIVFESNKLIIKTSSYSDCLREWARKCETFKVSYNSSKAETGELHELLGYLYQIKKNGSVYENDKDKFLASLKTYNSRFKDFCENQTSLLKKIGSFYFDNLEDADISEIASKQLIDIFTLENSEFLSRIEEAVKNFKANMARYKLATMWKEKTGTESPMAWSDKYAMPILCMIKSNDQDNARNTFEIINTQTNDKSKIDEAIEYLNHFSQFEDLNNDKMRDNAFRKGILKNYSSLIDDLDELKSNIKAKYPMTSPYYWIGSASIEEYIKNTAFQKYNNGGSSKANSIIDSMSSNELKSYLKQLVKENMIVGIEIINNKKIGG